VLMEVIPAVNKARHPFGTFDREPFYMNAIVKEITCNLFSKTEPVNEGGDAIEVVCAVDR
jgi:hypothetical protein